MAARKKPKPSNTPEGGAGQKPTKKPIPLGTDPAITLPSAKDKPLTLTYWDLWFALVAVKDCGGDLDRLWERMGERKGTYSIDRGAVERKRSHLRDLEGRLAGAGLTSGEVVEAAGGLARSEVRRARSRVLEHSERQYERSEAMRHTPRNHRLDNALRGYWGRFPISPQPYAEEVEENFEETGYYSHRDSFGLARTLDRYVERAETLSDSGQYAEALALLRGWMTAVIELMGHADDSYGSIGMSFGEAFTAYLKIPIGRTGIDEGVFFPDLLDFLIWEDYGLTNDEIEGYFKKLTQAQADLCIGHLRRQIDELKRDDLGYQGEEALTILGRVVAEQERFDLFEDLAREMGAREWRRVIRLADRAVKKRKKLLARQVFEAALTEGPHLKFLAGKYEQLKSGKWDPDPRK
jgi:hypothetical protein